MHAHDRVPVVDSHVDEHAVAHDAGIGDDSVETTEGVDGGTHQVAGAVPVADVIGVGDGFATGRDDVIHDLLGGTDVVTLAGERRADVVHDDLGALSRECPGMCRAEASARSGDDHDSSVTDSHVCAPV
ncbi:unannotated protein [freshwater metagenome]|uniref:Unannotated protein n=1 Tax=freshwater metagenome TaxID=449393 RepID=A0A6J5YJ64_9ZZZZ